MRNFLWTGCLSYLLIGLAHVIVGAVLPELLAHYGKDYSAGGQLVSLQFFGFLIGVLAGPWLSAKLGKRGALMLCLFCLAAAELVFFTLPAWSIVLLTAPFAGFGFGMVETIIGGVIIGYLEEPKKTSSMARLEVFFGVGALVMPLIVAAFIAGGWWRGAFLTLALMSAAVLALWMLLPMGKMVEVMSKAASAQVKEAVSVQAAKAPRTGRSLMWLALFIAMFTLYVGAEMSIANFLPSILLENAGVRPELGALSVTCFWGAMAVGRLFAAQLAGRWGHARYMIISCAGGTLALLAFASIEGIGASFAIILLLGLLMSGMFAVALVFANSFFPGKEERVTSILIASGGIGGALIPLLTGWCMDHLSLKVTLGVLVSFYALLLVLVLAASRLRRHSVPGHSGQAHY
ncbi:MFS transporter, FHS family, glucose/mannose:H+ symporter [Paenibacillus sp. UNCCL117]|uniref:MFS transporter n=1 Tax=unclassified Paenibacillus TaxID=185978 RepID=UPI00088EB324|nr:MULTISPECIES: MFS transporter [unclassified Paenibacillus]SDC18043.1 MFS transporter, FHS family, glucose/mannose:H+ symporter [Paenibacillus sp. cl123]SFW18127.1 MFS transporter, FHS family, glucose/mannose:H+ symporter [Paenibacillus sp. UNCCL117]